LTDAIHGWLDGADCFVLVKQRERLVEEEFIPASTRDQVTEILTANINNININSSARYDDE